MYTPLVVTFAVNLKLNYSLKIQLTDSSAAENDPRSKFQPKMSTINLSPAFLLFTA